MLLSKYMWGMLVNNFLTSSCGFLGERHHVCACCYNNPTSNGPGASSSCTERRAVDSCAETVLRQGNDCPFTPYVHTQSEISNVFPLCDLGRKVTQDRRTITGRFKKKGGGGWSNDKPRVHANMIKPAHGLKYLCLSGMWAPTVKAGYPLLLQNLFFCAWGR